VGIFEIEITFIEKATDKFGYWYIRFRGEGDNWRKAKEDCNRHRFWWNPDKKAWRVSEAWLSSDDRYFYTPPGKISDTLSEIISRWEAREEEKRKRWQSQKQQEQGRARKQDEWRRKQYTREDIPYAKSGVGAAYAMLGIPDNSDEETVKRVYWGLAKQYHPDRDSGDHKRMAAINAAHEVIIAYLNKSRWP